MRDSLAVGVALLAEAAALNALANARWVALLEPLAAAIARARWGMLA